MFETPRGPPDPQSPKTPPKHQEQENPAFGKPWFSYLMPLFFYIGGRDATGSSLQILDVDFCGGGDRQLQSHAVDGT